MRRVQLLCKILWREVKLIHNAVTQVWQYACLQVFAQRSLEGIAHCAPIYVCLQVRHGHQSIKAVVASWGVLGVGGAGSV